VAVGAKAEVRLPRGAAAVCQSQYAMGMPRARRGDRKTSPKARREFVDGVAHAAPDGPGGHDQPILEHERALGGGRPRPGRMRPRGQASPGAPHSGWRYWVDPADLVKGVDAICRGDRTFDDLRHRGFETLL
jgi:hypothetical protein